MRFVLMLLVVLLGQNSAQAGSGTRNGGHGYKIKDKIYSYDLVVSGRYSDPYDSLDYKGQLSATRVQHLREVFDNLMNAKWRDDNQVQHDLFADKEKVIQVWSHKIQQLHDIMVEMELSLDLDALLAQMGRYQWLFQDVETPLVIDGEDPKDRVIDEKFQEFLPEKVQAAVREGSTITFYRSFAQMNDGMQQIAVMFHEAFYAFIDENKMTVGPHVFGTNYEIRRQVYGILGDIFSPNLKNPNSIFRAALTRDIWDIDSYTNSVSPRALLQETTAAPRIPITIDSLFPFAEANKLGILPQANARTCYAPGGIFWTNRLRDQCDKVESPAKTYRLCAGKRDADTYYVWVNRFAGECEERSYPVIAIAGTRIGDKLYLQTNDDTNKENDKLADFSFDGNALTNFCYEPDRDAACNLRFENSKNFELDEQFRLEIQSSDKKYRDYFVDEIVSINPEVFQTIRISPRARLCAGFMGAKSQILLWQTKASRSCRVGRLRLYAAHTIVMGLTNAGSLKGQVFSYGYQETMLKKAPNFILRQIGSEPRTVTPSSRVIYSVKKPYDFVREYVDKYEQNLGFFNFEANELEYLCTSAWTGLCSITSSGPNADIPEESFLDASLTLTMSKIDVRGFDLFSLAIGYPTDLVAIRMKYLVEVEKKDINATNDFGYTALMMAVRGRYSPVTTGSDCHPQNTKSLLDLGADPNVAHPSLKYTALDYAQGDKSNPSCKLAVEYLMGRGARSTGLEIGWFNNGRTIEYEKSWPVGTSTIQYSPPTAPSPVYGGAPPYYPPYGGHYPAYGGYPYNNVAQPIYNSGGGRRR